MEDRVIKTSDFSYRLPAELIARKPVEPRDHSRLMIFDRTTGSIEHALFYQIGDYLKPGDVLVFNNSRVIPARLHGAKRYTGAQVEILLLQRGEEGIWEALVKPARRLPPGSVIDIITQNNAATELTATVVGLKEEGIRLIAFSNEKALDHVGEVPLPPYIHEKLEDKERYQTVFASIPGSVAAPTAGLHFTPTLLQSLQNKGVSCAPVTLHVGLDTFRPVKEYDARDHHIHNEYAVVSAAAANSISQAKREGRRVIAVGTTVVRLLEAMALLHNPSALEVFSGWVSLYILPGHRFQVIDAMVTNFHLPRSSLLMMVSAFAGREPILRAYEEAIGKQYRFYSFGDAMLIL